MSHLPLEGVVVCFTNTPHDIREEKIIMIKEMGGDACYDFDPHRVTHLVAENCDTSSAKYGAAVRLKLPVVKLAWIDAAWNEFKRNKDFDSNHSDILRFYKTPLFTECEVTLTGFHVNERVDLGRLIELHGGRYSSSMNKVTTTHLIASRNSGEKYNKALQWRNIKIVSTNWLTKSIEIGYRLPEKHFVLEKDLVASNKTGTKLLDNIKTERPQSGVDQSFKKLSGELVLERKQATDEEDRVEFSRVETYKELTPAGDDEDDGRTFIVHTNHEQNVSADDNASLPLHQLDIPAIAPAETQEIAYNHYVNEVGFDELNKDYEMVEAEAEDVGDAFFSQSFQTTQDAIQEPQTQFEFIISPTAPQDVGQDENEMILEKRNRDAATSQVFFDNQNVMCSAEEVEAYAKIVSISLKRIPPKKMVAARREIDQILFNFQFGQSGFEAEDDD